MKDLDKELNKLVIRVDGDKNEWTFTGEIWQTIRDEFKQRDLAWQKKIKEALPEEITEDEMYSYSENTEWERTGFNNCLKEIKKNLNL